MFQKWTAVTAGIAGVAAVLVTAIVVFGGDSDTAVSGTATATQSSTSAPLVTKTAAANGAPDEGTSDADTSAGVSGLAAPAAQTAQGSEPGITVSGDGSVSVEPDTAVLYVGVQVTEPTVQAARGRAAEGMQKIVDSLKANGLSDDEIQTTSFSIQPQYDYSNSGTSLRGYTVWNSVQATVRRDAATIGEAASKVIDDAAAAGGNSTIIQGVQFSLSNESAAVTSAREKAVADARSKAEQLAGFASLTLGAPTIISEAARGSVPIYYYGPDAAQADRSTPVQAGVLTVSVSVQITFAIQ
jgi:uncharacterized protein YggE